MPQTFVSVEEYLKAEREALEKSEYRNGEVFAMAGASLRHTIIVTNLVSELSRRLKERPCTVHSTDLRLRVSATGLYTYPDVVVVCGPRQLAEEDPDTLVNPTLIFEVLSESTKNYDRGEKFRQYRTLGSLAEYLLVAQDSIHVEQYVKHEGSWVLAETDDAAAIIRVGSVGCELPVAEIYHKVEFS